ncbi:nitrate ABC transporter substrate-binding protein, partial [Rhizobium ruizarguesonis]
TDDAVTGHAETLAKVLRAVAKGWALTHEHPEEAVKLTVEAYPQLDLAVELKTVPRILSLSFDASTGREGWGSFDPAALAEQIAVYDKIGQFKSGEPKLE